MKKLNGQQKEKLAQMLEELINTRLMRDLYGDSWLDEIKVTYHELTPAQRLQKLFEKGLDKDGDK